MDTRALGHDTRFGSHAQLFQALGTLARLMRIHTLLVLTECNGQDVLDRLRSRVSCVRS